MNVILILCDTLTRASVGAYHRGLGGRGFTNTPNIDALAERGVTFENHWINSAPCMPARRDLFSGRIEFPWRSWGPRESFDPDWSISLEDSDVSSYLFTDHANLFDIGSGNYHHHFDGYHFQRGHFNDHLEIGVPVEPGRKGHPRTIYRSAWPSFENGDSTFAAQTLTAASEWIQNESPHTQPFFLFIDEFDPHWPLDPPEPYRSLYLDECGVTSQTAADAEVSRKSRDRAATPLNGFFKGGSVADYSAGELQWLRAQYAGKVTMVDHYLGRLFDAIDQRGLWDDTMVILTTDHGEFLGEYGQVSKGSGYSYPLFAQIPLIIAAPGSDKGRTCHSLTCAVDLHPTVLNYLGVGCSPHTHGNDIGHLLAQCKQESPSRPGGREDLIYGWWGREVYWTDGKYLFCKAPENRGPLYQYGTNLGEKCVGLSGKRFDRYAECEVGVFLPHTTRPVYRVRSDGLAYGAEPPENADLLFDLATDPECRNNVIESGPSIEAVCKNRLSKLMNQMEVPQEQFERLGL
jgi:arylsulfatase A-like enzyme